MVAIGVSVGLAVCLGTGPVLGWFAGWILWWLFTDLVWGWFCTDWFVGWLLLPFLGCLALRFWFAYLVWVFWDLRWVWLLGLLLSALLVGGLLVVILVWIWCILVVMVCVGGCAYDLVVGSLMCFGALDLLFVCVGGFLDICGWCAWLVGCWIDGGFWFTVWLCVEFDFDGFLLGLAFWVFVSGGVWCMVVGLRFRRGFYLCALGLLFGCIGLRCGSGCGILCLVWDFGGILSGLVCCGCAVSLGIFGWCGIDII